MPSIAEAMRAKIIERLDDVGPPSHDPDMPDHLTDTVGYWVCDTGMVYGSAAGAHALWGRIWEAYEQSNGIWGDLGLPISDVHEVIRFEGGDIGIAVGWSAEFEHGRIMQAGEGPAYVVFGAVWQRYASAASELGFPVEAAHEIGDGWSAQAFRAHDGVGRDGVIYVHQDGRAFHLHDDRFARPYLAAGGPTGWLGMPTGDPVPETMTRGDDPPEPITTLRFERGRIGLTPMGGSIDLPTSRRIEKRWQPKSPIDIRVDLSVAADGTVAFSGRAYASGYPSYWYAAAVVFRAARADGSDIAIATDGHVGGWMDPDERGQSWSVGKTDLTIADNWGRVALAEAEVRFHASVDGVALTLQVLLAPLLAPLWVLGELQSSCTPTTITTRGPNGETESTVVGCGSAGNYGGGLEVPAPPA